MLVISGVGPLIAAAFPWRSVDGGFVVPPAHVVGGMMTFLGAGFGLTVLSWRIASDPSWHELATFVRVSGLTLLVLAVAFNVLARAPEAPLYAWAGILQRISVAVWFACTMLLAWRLRAVGAVSAARRHAATVAEPRFG